MASSAHTEKNWEVFTFIIICLWNHSEMAEISSFFIVGEHYLAFCGPLVNCSCKTISPHSIWSWSKAWKLPGLTPDSFFLDKSDISLCPRNVKHVPVITVAGWLINALLPCGLQRQLHLPLLFCVFCVLWSSKVCFARVKLILLMVHLQAALVKSVPVQKGNKVYNSFRFGSRSMKAKHIPSAS